MNLAAIALVRILIKTIRGEKIRVTPVGVIRDLPESVTGINRNDDLAEREAEAASRKTEET